MSSVGKDAVDCPLEYRIISPARIIKNKIDKQLYSIGKTMNGNPYHPAPMTVNRYLGGINKVKLIEYS